MSSKTVHMPKGAGLQASTRRGDIAVVALPPAFSRQSTAPVPADEAAIARACDESQSGKVAQMRTKLAL
jgi:hypothetical protein